MIRTQRTLRHWAVLSLCVLLGSPEGVRAAEFCVSTSQTLRAALATAAGNGEHDIIRLQGGLYEPTDGGVAFSYNTPENFDLEVVGGHAPLGPIPCVPALGVTTVLSGAGNRRVVQFTGQAGTSGNITLRRLTIRNGFSAGDAGGILIGNTSGFTGNVLLEHLVIRNNTAGTFGAGVVGSGGTFTLSNSLLTLNQCGGSHCAASVTVNDPDATNAILTRIIGNTVAINTCSDDACTVGGIRVGFQARALVANNAFAFNAHSDLRLDTSTELRNNRYDTRVGTTPAADTGNLVGADPVFLDALSLDFRPAPASPLIEAGLNGLPLPGLDLNGIARVFGSAPDIGAYESTSPPFRDGFEDAP